MVETRSAVEAQADCDCSKIEGPIARTIQPLPSGHRDAATAAAPLIASVTPRAACVRSDAEEVRDEVVHECDAELCLSGCGGPRGLASELGHENGERLAHLNGILDRIVTGSTHRVSAHLSRLASKLIENEIDEYALAPCESPCFLTDGNAGGATLDDGDD
jgi:hypothetical protein